MLSFSGREAVMAAVVEIEVDIECEVEVLL
jgi:hypothetical protein